MKMNLKKSLLVTALAATTLGMSAGALALTFTDGNLNGTVDIKGKIIVPQAVNEWQWGAGDPLDFPKSVTDMTGDYKKLTIAMTADTPLLVGQTKQATIGTPGSAGLTPQITFADSAGTAVTIDFTGASADGKGTLTLPVTDNPSSGTPVSLGTAVLQVTAAGVQGYQITAPTAMRADLISCATDGSSMNMFGTGALPSTPAGVIPARAGIGWVSALGATKGSTQLLADVQTLSGASLPDWTDTAATTGCGFGSVGHGFIGVYGLGLATGQTITVDFANQVQTTTKWKAPLNIAITHI